jgi:SAM-dependent methyltransferase
MNERATQHAKAAAKSEYSATQPWSEALENLHQESSRTHFLDVWTRSAMIERLSIPHERAVILDLGCSTGYLLEDLRAEFPGARLVGIDYVQSGLVAALASGIDAGLLRADAQKLPLRGDVDAIVSANLLEHIPDDVGALREMFAVVRRGSSVILVVPAGARLYDYYDRFLYHQRRYARHELATKARSVGFEVLDDIYLGSLFYPLFWLVKKRNRLFRRDLAEESLQRQVALDIKNTKDSRLGRLATRAEAVLLAASVKLPFGVRELVALRRPY